jgi:hypothetical protein
MSRVFKMQGSLFTFRAWVTAVVERAVLASPDFLPFRLVVGNEFSPELVQASADLRQELIKVNTIFIAQRLDGGIGVRFS